MERKYPNKETKYLMIHADDAGLSHSSNRAVILAFQEGIVNSCSIMVPCAGFEEMADFAKNNPTYDYGVHLTLTCEWERKRFGPILPASEVPTLVDEDGFFYKKRNELKAKASIEEVKKELEAQIEKALDYGISPSHLDSHMYSLGISKEMCAVYRDLGAKYNLPVFMNEELFSMVSDTIYIEESDWDIEHIYSANYNQFLNGEMEEYYFQALDNLKPGINILLLHPAYDDEEMKEITINHPNFGSEWREIDLSFSLSEKARRKIENKGLHLIDWRGIAEMQKSSMR